MKLKNKMTKVFRYVLIIFFLLNSNSFAKEDFFAEAKNLFDSGKYEESKFLLQRNIVFHPKDSKSYLYLAKIYNHEKNRKEEEKNVNTVLLLEPKNEEAIYMLMEIELKKSNYMKVKNLSETFLKICIELCDKNNLILKSLTNLEPKNES